MIDILTTLTNGAGLSAPVRNRYFYGKLLDVHHLEMEQSYFLEMGRLMNRLTLGSGVLCGLRAKPGEGNTVVVSPGVAVDGHGREIVVTEQVTLDLASLEEDPAEGDAPAEPVEPAPAPIRLGTVLCLSYHECDVEPSPVLVADCDLRETCAPGAVRERFKFTLMPASRAPLPEDPCSILGAYSRQPRPISEGEGESTHVIERRLVAALESEVEIGNVLGGTRQRTAAALRQRLCHAFHPPCGPGSDCVPVALIRKGPQGGLAVDECLPRTTIYSNAVLLDLILCLAEQMEKCCERRVTVTAPKIVDTWPPPATPATPPDQPVPTEVKLADMQSNLQLQNQELEGGIAISFDRAMNADRLKVPDEWLRVLVLLKAEGAGGLPLQLELDHVTDTTLLGNTGQTAYYGFKPVTIPTVSGGTLAAFHGAASVGFNELIQAVGSGLVLVLIRSDDVTQIAAADDSELLDADFAGTSLTSEMTDMLWSLGALGVTLAGSLRARIEVPPSPMPPLPSSGNNIEGGVFHSSFQITP